MPPKNAIRVPFKSGWLLPFLAIYAPTIVSVVKDKSMLIQPAIFFPNIPSLASMNGDIAIKHENNGVAKTKREAMKAFLPSDSVCIVSSSSWMRAFSSSSTRLSPSRISASYTLTPEEIPRAMLLLTSVSIISLRSGCITKADPDTTPRSVKVASKRVLIKNFRILESISIPLSQLNLADHVG